jgi:signal transduction histidine kinase
MKKYIVIIGILAAIMVALATLSVFFQRTLQMDMAEQFNKQQLLLASAQATNMHEYLRNVQDEVFHIAQSVPLFQVRKKADFKFITRELFKDTTIDIKKQIKFLDRQGDILFERGNVHAEGPDEKKIITKALRACPGNVQFQQDTKLLSIVAPICRLDSFMGAVVLTLDVQDIGHAFLASLKSGWQENAWIMDEKGTLLYHPTQPTMVGRNLHKTDSSCFRCHKSFEAEQKIIEGRGDYCSGDYYGRYVSPTGEDKILAYSSVMAGDARWIVAVSAPYSEVTLSIKRSMKLYTWIIILIAMATSGISAWLIVLNQKRERAEERAKHERELEMMHSEKLASLSRLTSGITSEIGNPLTSVLSFVRVLMDMEEDEFKKETLETIFFHTNRIADIQKQLSGFSKINSLELKPCRVNKVIENSLSLIQYDQRVQNITVVRDLASDLPEITSDGDQLSEAIVNIVLNSADAMPDGGTLTIRSRMKEGRIVIDFEDTGAGIAKEQLSKIFDPFFTTKERGTGLGLAVSYSIIKKLNGNLTAESEPGKGSRFTISLPVNGEK